MSLNIGILESSRGVAANLLLDIYGGAAAAYSLRKLRTAYSGAAIRVRRSGDSTETNIGFVNGQLDTTTLLTFCGSGNGFITIWYDQSGNSKDASQNNISLQPEIVRLGALRTINSKPTLQNQGYNYLTASSASGRGSGILYNWCFSAYNNTSLDEANMIVYEVPNTSSVFSGGTASVINGFGGFGSPVLLSTTYEPIGTTLSLGTIKTPAPASIYINGTFNTSTALGWQGSYMLIYGGTFNAAQGFRGNISEIVLYNTDQSANRIGIETNINSFYSIY